MPSNILHVRAETKPLEHRTAITPTIAKKLVDAGYTVNVERSPLSIFPDSEYEGTGASLVPTGSWTDVPSDHIIIGLKELPEEDFPLKHTHVQFAHCYKNQGGWDTVLGRFDKGNGTLLDLEFLEDENRRRVAAFGYHAGFAGAALALLTWAWQLKNGKDKPLPSVSSYENEHLLIDDVKKAVEEGKAQAGHYPRILVIGALGRCGRGAVDLCVRAGLEDIIVSHRRNKHILSLTSLTTPTEVGPPRNLRQARPIPGDRRVRRLRQLHLPLGQDPALHRRQITLGRVPPPERRLRCLLRHHQPSQPHPHLRHQHHLLRADCARVSTRG